MAPAHPKNVIICNASQNEFKTHHKLNMEKKTGLLYEHDGIHPEFKKKSPDPSIPDQGIFFRLLFLICRDGPYLTANFLIFAVRIIV